MATATSEKNNLFANLKGKLQDTPEPIVQTRVEPTKPKKQKAAEQLFSFHIPSEKLTALKMKAIADNTTVKDLINNALIAHYDI